MPEKFQKLEPGDEVVISGVAGRFPKSDNFAQLQENLFNKVDLISDDESRWKAGRPDIPHRTGKINNLEKFDSQFFGIDFTEAESIDHMPRMLMEHAYEAIVDAGINPQQLRGTNTGIFIGTCYIETEHDSLNDTQLESGFGLTGCSRSMMANRLSRWLGCTGPSYTVDTACSSSLFALNQAYRAIRRGECDAALVGGCVLSSDGTCKSFDDDANGYCRSEAASVIFLQKAHNAKRAYAQVIHTKTNCDGFKEEGITYPSKTMQRTLLEQVYEECGVPPTSLAYMEAHGTGTKVGDPVEAEAIDKVFCSGRGSPLQIGTVKSNLGHSEPASGLCSIAKVIIAMESGYIPPNLHYNRPCRNIPSLVEGRIQVVTELTPWDGGYVGINSFGFGGGNAHILLKSNPKEKINNGAPKDTIPRLIVISARTKEAVTFLLDNLESRPVDVEYVSLFHNIHAGEIPGHLFRGFTILPALGLSEKSIRDVQPYAGLKRPVCFVFSGMGSQWSGMGTALLTIPAFAKAAQKCQATLEPYGLNVINILTNKDPKILHNVLNSFVGIAAIQIGLVDVLACLHIVPDFTIGYSVGELGCAYANGCLTAEQVVLAAYFQGLALVKAELERGLMASVEIGHVELVRICPADIDIACHDSPESTTISGPAESIEAFVVTLQKKGIAARVEPSSNIAYHSRYVATVGPKLLTYLQDVIPYPKSRGEKWLSTSVPQRNWETSSAQLCSSEYHTNNLLSPVLFEEISHSIPNNAITIEIAPQGFLQTLLRKLLNKNVINISLTERGSENSDEVLLRAIGKLYEAGLHPQLTSLYPEIQYPVSRGTPMISPLLRWDHSKKWQVFNVESREIQTGERIVDISLADAEFDWMAGHVIDGRILVPATGYLAIVWQTLALMRGVSYLGLSVVFENVSFHRATTLPKEGIIRLAITIHKGSGKFEIIESGAMVVTGLIHAVQNTTHERVGVAEVVYDNEEGGLTAKDVYKELRLRGYNYEALFRRLEGVSLDGTKGRITWDKNWTSFMDNMLQMKILGIDTRGLFVPTGIRKLVIDPGMHANQLRAMSDDKPVFPVEVRKDLDSIVSGGVLIQGLKANAIARKKFAGDPVIEDFKFIAHRDRSEMELEVVTRIATHIAIENMLSMTIKTIELIGEADISPENLTSPIIKEVLGNIPALQASVNIIAPTDKFSDSELFSDITILTPKELASQSDAHLVTSHDLLTSRNTETLTLLKSAMSDGGFLLAREPLNLDSDIVSVIKSQGFHVVLEKRTKSELVILLRAIEKQFDVVSVVYVNNEFKWLTTLQDALKAEAKQRTNSRRILVVSEGDSESGLLGLVNCLRREPGGELIQGLFIQDPQAQKFSLNDPFYAEQLKLGLALNVLRTGKLWGSYRFFKMASLALKPVHHARINQYTRGDLSAIKWVEGIIQPENRNRNIIKIHYSSINFRDVMLGTGKLAVEVAAKTRQDQESVIGFEFSGIDVDGTAVMGMIETGALSNLCICDRELLWAVPKNWTLDDAATVPAVYGTAYYALFLSGKMKKGDKVLIHAGSGGVGQAAITLALNAGCEVFTTVGTPEKREFIKTQFPQIDEDHIGNSRDTSFEQLVLRQTHGQGVDIVLNSLAEEKLQASIRCLTTGGRFLEIGKFDLAANNPLGTEAFLKGISFHGVLLDNLFTASSDRKKELVAMLDRGIKNGAVKPLPKTVFAMDQVEAAFRYMATGKHIGKVIVKVHAEDDKGQSQLPLGIPRYHCLEEYSHLILGGLGGFGLELVDWLVLRGAKKIVLTSRTGISNGYQRLRINVWRSYGVEVVIVAGKDASTHEGCVAILEEAIQLGPVGAIFNLAVVLKDALFENQTEATFEESFRVKARATKQLDQLSRKMCPHLKHFVVFSSVSCGRGNAGQTNYGMSNSVMERICETRAAEGLPGLAIQWGAVGDVGLVAEMREDNKEVVIGGTIPQKISSCLQVLDFLLQQKSTVVSSMVVAEKKSVAGATNIVDAVLNIMELKDLKNVSAHSPLTELGMDSMMAVEIKQTLERDFDVFLSAPDIRSLTFAKLQELSQNLTKDDENNKIERDNEIDGLDYMRLLVRNLEIGQVSKDVCIPLVTRTDNKRGEVFIIPGIEGTYAVCQPLADKLNSPATCLQLGARYLNLTTIEEMADYFIPHVKARITSREDFVIVGYSFGSIVAIELVRRLESEDFSGRLVLIDGSPDYLKELVDFIFHNTSESQMESTFLLHLLGFLGSSSRTQLEEDLQTCITWEDKLRAFAKNIPESMSGILTYDYTVAMCSSLYSRMKAVLKYDPSVLPPLKTPITLIKPTMQAVRSMTDDYGLGSLTQAKVEIYHAEGDHTTVLENHLCAALIDGELNECAMPT